MISDTFLRMLRCPEQRTPLTLADSGLVASLNAAVAAGTLVNRGGERLTQPLDGALVRADGAVAYPILDGIPVLIIDAALEVEPRQS